jgi:hypothetical protein
MSRATKKADDNREHLKDELFITQGENLPGERKWAFSFLISSGLLETEKDG